MTSTSSSPLNLEMQATLDLDPNALKTVSIVGAGLVGCLASIFYAQSGWQVQVYEQRKDLRTTPFSRERSINMALSYRGMLALRHCHFPFEKLVPWMVPMEGRMIHKSNGELEAQPYGLHGECIYSIDRRKLNECLLNEAEKLPNVNFNFEYELKDIEWEPLKTRFYDKKTQSYVTVKQDLIVGADGAYSNVRKEMIRPTRMSVHQDYMDHAYLELTIPALAQPTSSKSMVDSSTLERDEDTLDVEEEDEDERRPLFAMAPTHLHIWPRRTFMLIALPNQDGSFTCTLFAPWSLLDSLTSELDFLLFFEKYFPDTLPLFTKDQLLKAFHQHPRNPLIQITCSTYHYLHKCILLGDAAHAMVPFYGQGMNCGFEDIDVLFQLYHPPSSPLSMTETHLFTSPTPNVFSHPIKKTTTTTPKSSKPTTTTTQVLSPSLTKYMKNDLSYSVEKHPNFVDFSNVSSPEDPTTHQQQRIFEMYTAQRRPDILAIVSLAQSNYLEMRSNVISPMHRWRTYLIHFYVNYLVPNPWRPYLGCTPLYTLISFTNVPYHECLQRGRTQFLVSQTCLLSLMVLGSSVISWTGYHGFLTLKRHTSNYLLRSPSTTTLTTLMTEPNMVHSKPPFFNQLVKVSQEGLQWTYSFLKQGMLHLVRTTTMLIQGSSRPLSSSGSRGSGVDGESLHES